MAIPVHRDQPATISPTTSQGRRHWSSRSGFTGPLFLNSNSIHLMMYYYQHY